MPGEAHRPVDNGVGLIKRSIPSLVPFGVARLLDMTLQIGITAEEIRFAGYQCVE